MKSVVLTNVSSREIIRFMRNALEVYRQEHGLSFVELAILTGLDGSKRGVVHNHCSGRRNIGASYAVRYHLRLGIPLTSLCPDLVKEGAENAA